MEPDRFFSQADLDAIQDAVREAEGRTSGEIVPYVVERSDEYPTTAWKGAALGALLGPMVALPIHRWTDVWGWPLGLWIALPAPLGGAVGYLLALIAPVRRWLAGEPTPAAPAPRRPPATPGPAGAPRSPSSIRRSSAPATGPASSSSSPCSSAGSCCSPTPASTRRWRRGPGRRSPAGWPRGSGAAGPPPR